MNNFTIILPIYNDWKSLNTLLDQMENSLKNSECSYRILLVNDCSTEKNIFKLNNNNFFKEIKVLNLKQNIGSQKAIATGIKYISKNKKEFSEKFIIMDSDGEDDPNKIKEIVNTLENNNNIKIITLNRSIRKESFFFSILYEIHLFVTFLLTFNYIRFGNFSYIDGETIDKISQKKDLWLAYSATLKKFFTNKSKILAPRKKRISGKSKMSYFNLFKHSINIQAVFFKNIFLSSAIYSILLIYIFTIGFSYLIPGVMIFFFIFYISIIKFFSKDSNINLTFKNCLENIGSIEII